MPLNGIFLLLGLYSKPIDFFLNDSEYLTVGAAKADREIWIMSLPQENKTSWVGIG